MNISYTNLFLSRGTGKTVYNMLKVLGAEASRHSTSLYPALRDNYEGSSLPVGDGGTYETLLERSLQPLQYVYLPTVQGQIRYCQVSAFFS